jgi:hypothetical protein
MQQRDRDEQRDGGIRVVRYSCPETLTEHHVIRKQPELLGRYLGALEAEEPSENRPRMWLSRVVLVGQHDSEDVPPSCSNVT